MDAQNFSKGHFDLNSPLSLYSKMGSKWAQKFTDRLQELPECAEMLTDETVLKQHLEKAHGFCPTGADHRYRLQLWLEYENSVRMERPMQMKNVYSLTGPESTFHQIVMKDARRVAWMLCKPVSYEMQTREILATGMARLRGYLDKDAFPEGGKPDHRLATLQLNITKMADLRLHGAPTQKIQEISIKGVLGANGEIQAAVDSMDMKALEDRKRELEQRKKAAEGRASKGAAGAAGAPILDAEIVKEDEGEENEVEESARDG